MYNHVKITKMNSSGVTLEMNIFLATQSRADLRACGPVGVRGVPHLRPLPGLRQPHHLRLPQRELPQGLQEHLKLHAVLQVRGTGRGSSRGAKRNKLGNVWVFVHLIHRPNETKNPLHKNPNIA